MRRNVQAETFFLVLYVRQKILAANGSQILNKIKPIFFVLKLNGILKSYLALYFDGFRNFSDSITQYLKTYWSEKTSQDQFCSYDTVL